MEPWQEEYEEHQRAIKRINDGYPCLYCNATYDKKNDPDRRMQGSIYHPPITHRVYETVTVNHHAGCELAEKLKRETESYAVGDEMRRQAFIAEQAKLPKCPVCGDPVNPAWKTHCGVKLKKPRKKK